MFRHKCQNWNSDLQTKIWWKTSISVEKCNSFFYKFWSPIKKMCRTFGGIVQQGRESCIILVRRIFLKTKQFFWATWFFHLFVAQSGKEFNFWLFFYTADKKLRFASAEHKFEELFRTFFNFFNKLPDLRINFLHS